MSEDVEILSGVGRVFGGDRHVADVNYRLEIAGDEAGFEDIEGEIEVIGDKELIFTIFNAARTTTLVLEDGRRIGFTLNSPDEESGRATIEYGAFRRAP